MAEIAGVVFALIDLSSLFRSVFQAHGERTSEIFLDISDDDFRHRLKRRTGQAQWDELRRHRPAGVEDEKAGASAQNCSREYDVEGSKMHHNQHPEDGSHETCHACEQSISSPRGLRALREVLEQAGVHTAVLVCMRISSNFAIAQNIVDLSSKQASWILHIPLPPRLEASLYIRNPPPMLFFAATMIWVAIIHGHSHSSSAVRQLACLTAVVVSSVAVGQGIGLSTVASLLCISPWLLYSGLMIAMLVRRSTNTKDKLTSSAMKCSERDALGRTTIAAPQKH